MKKQGGGCISHSLRKKTRGRPSILTSLLRYFLISFFKNGSALSAVMGASAKRAHRLQERRSLQRKDSVFLRWRRRRHIRQKFPSVALLDRVARGHREQRRRRFRPLNVRQCVGRISKTGIRMRALDVHLQVRRIPPLRHPGNRLLVDTLSS